MVEPGFFCLIQSLTTALQQAKWEMTIASCNEIVPGSPFHYSGKEPIEASLVKPKGRNWTAAVEGNFKVRICIDNIMASVVVHVAYQHYTLYIIVSNLIKLKSICFHCIM